MKLLIVDDHKLFNDGLKSLLIQNIDSVEIEQVFDSRETLQSIHLHAPSVVLLDLNMPYINGLEMANLILKNFPSQKIIILSMYADNAQIDQFKKDGVKGYLLKTVDFVELSQAITLVMAGNEYFPKNDKENNHSEDNFMKKYRLTTREVEVIRLIKSGNNNQGIADFMHLSVHTIITHRKNIHLKLAIQKERDLIKFALENGI
jgi:DNA-binding NarL/FixJ family response regulator